MDVLKTLRQHLASLGVDGVLIPRGDAFSGEEVPPSDERLRYISGFSGSAGTALVTATESALFSDGRYTIQMAAETHDDWSCHTQPEASMIDWIKKHLKDGVLGFDPWLMTLSSYQNFQQKLNGSTVQLKPLAQNPIDAIWPDQPLPPQSPAWDFDPSIAGLSRSEKIKAVLAAIKSTAPSCKHMIITAPDQLAWLANIRGNDLSHTPVILSFAILNEDGHITIFADESRFDACDRQSLKCHPPQDCLAYIDTLNPAEVMIDPASCPYALAEALGDQAVQWESPITMMKAKKTPAEQKAIRAVHRRDGAAMARFLCWFDQHAGQGIREVDIDAKLIECRSQDDHFISPSFATICGSGGNGAIVHYRAEDGMDSEILEDTLCLIDSGGQYQDGTTDITRTLAVGDVSPAMKHDFTLVLKAHIALDQAVFPDGTSGVQLDAITRQPLWQAAMDFAHGTGHGVGCCLNVHEGPVSISKRSTRGVEAGVLLSNEPGYYIEGAYGIRIENLILSQKDGDKDGYLCFDPVTVVPMDSRLVETALLTDAELAWLNAYHAKVWDEIAPLLAGEADVLDWLRQATQPIRRH